MSANVLIEPIRLQALRRALMVVFFAALVAACQTTGLKPGAINTTFPPSGWQTQKSGAATAYLCTNKRCRTPQLVLVTPMKVRGNAEQAIRENIISTELLRSLDNVIKVASKRSVVISNRRKVTTRTYSGFEAIATLRDRAGKRVYVAHRNIVQADRGITVSSVSYNRSTAQRNLRRYLAQTQFRRVN